MAEKHRYTVVVAVDASDASSIVLQHAINVAGRYDEVDFQVASVVPTTWFRGRDEAHVEEAKALEARLAEFVGESLNGFESLDISKWRLRIIVRTGDVLDELTFLAEWAQADLVVVGREDLSGGRAGSGVTQALIDGVNCPVLVVKPKEHRHLDEIQYTGTGRVVTMSTWMAPSHF